ncbi:MAG: SDR family oxidoreductase [Bacteroidales bacterium]
MKILVIGASGLLAAPVIRQLDSAGFDLRLFSRSVNRSMFVNEYEIVNGDLFLPGDLEKAVDGCDAVHITVSGVDEFKAAETIVTMAKKKEIQLVSLVSGATVKEENRWFEFTDKKFRAEQLLMNSGIPYLIFRPTWFFESLGLMVRDGKAMVLGRQPHPYHFVAADDFGKMVARACSDQEKWNGVYYVYGPERFLMKDLLEKYCRALHPEIKKVSETPLFVLKMIAGLTGNRMLKYATSLYAYFQKVEEPVIPERELRVLGEPELKFEQWLELQSDR